MVNKKILDVFTEYNDNDITQYTNKFGLEPSKYVIRLISNKGVIKENIKNIKVAKKLYKQYKNTVDFTFIEISLPENHHVLLEKNENNNTIVSKIYYNEDNDSWTDMVNDNNEDVRNTYINVINPNIDIDENIKLEPNTLLKLRDFLNYCLYNLGIDECPKIQIVNDRKNGMTTGAFDPVTNVLYVLGRNRSLIDILRTIAHELVHYKQQLENQIPDNLDGRDKKLEDEANIFSGDIIYNYVNENKENDMIYDM